MRKILLILLICITSISMYAQEEHFKFCGIEIDGTIEAFNEKMIKKGFVLKQKGSDYRDYKGLFQDEEFDVHVLFDVKQNFVYYCMLRGKCNYSPIINRLTKKYGTPKGEGSSYSDKIWATSLGIIILNESDDVIHYVDKKNYNKHDSASNDDL